MSLRNNQHLSFFESMSNDAYFISVCYCDNEVKCLSLKQSIHERERERQRRARSLQRNTIPIQPSVSRMAFSWKFTKWSVYISPALKHRKIGEKKKKESSNLVYLRHTPPPATYVYNKLLQYIAIGAFT